MKKAGVMAMESIKSFWTYRFRVLRAVELIYVLRFILITQ